MTKCSYCGERAVWSLFHRNGTESYICDKCSSPEPVHSISKVGLEFKSDNWMFVTMEESTDGQA